MKLLNNTPRKTLGKHTVFFALSFSKYLKEILKSEPLEEKIRPGYKNP